MSQSIILNIRQKTAAWSRVKNLQQRLMQAAKVAQEHLPQKLRFPIVTNLLLTTNADIRRLNRDFRHIDQATNVLSFPQYEPQQLSQFRATKTPLEIGDIVIAYQYIVGEAKKDHKTLINHIVHLFLHGLLHLFGYDHKTDPEATRMERLEIKIMAALDLPDPYATANSMEPQRSRSASKKRRIAKHSKTFAGQKLASRAPKSFEK